MESGGNLQLSPGSTTRPIRLGAVFSHPIQYNSPLFRELANRDGVDLTVCYCYRPSAQQQGAGFGISFQWDLDLLSGYKHLWLKNRSHHPSGQSFLGCNTPEIARRVLRGEFDVVWVQGWNVLSMWQAIVACWAARIPLMIRAENHLHVTMPFWKKVVKSLLFPLFIRRFSICLAIGNWSEEYYRRYGARAIVEAPYCVDNRLFARQAAEERVRRVEHRQGWGIPAEAVVFLFAGKFELKKRPMDLLQALHQMSDVERPKVWLLMVGDGALRSICEAYAAEHRLPVTFTGFLNQGKIPAAYAAADCLVLPSDGRETWGLVVNEAMASGIPAIVSDQVGCGPDLVLDGVTGWRFPLGDTYALSECITRLARDKPLLETMKERAVSQVAEYSIERAVDGICRALDAVRARSGGRRSRRTP